MKQLINITKDINFISVIKLYSICESCIKNWQTKKLSKQLQEFIIKFLNCINLDVNNLITFLAIENKKYFLLFINKISDCY